MPRSGSTDQRGPAVGDGGRCPKSPRAKVWLDRSKEHHGWRWRTGPSSTGAVGDVGEPQIPACQGLARRVRGAPWLGTVGDIGEPERPACQGLARRVKGASWLATVDDAPNPRVPRSGSTGQRSIVVDDSGPGLARRVRWAMSVSPKSLRAKVWLDRSEGPRG